MPCRITKFLIKLARKRKSKKLSIDFGGIKALMRLIKGNKY